MLFLGLFTLLASGWLPVVLQVECRQSPMPAPRCPRAPPVLRS